ncbi:MAG TPA: bifunctional phosphoribosylaminoimidazolecarboxamide formyltransferase/IMP cyclohydrolase [Thermaerobacter sp.]
MTEHAAFARAGAGGGARRRALLSVADKAGIVELGRSLHRLGWELVSTGGTARVLAEAGLPVTPVSRVTGFPELLEGRVKTLHPAIHGGILARRDRPDDLASLQAHGIAPIDLVAVNLYPFAQAAAAGVRGPALLEEIDIGGPALIRAAAKNWPFVIVLVDPGDYGPVVARLEAEGQLPAALRRQLAVKAFGHTSAYDAVIARVLAAEEGDGAGEKGPAETAAEGSAGTAGEEPGAGPWPAVLHLTLRREAILRYGENPHQPAALYRLDAAGGTSPGQRPAGGFVQHGGKPMSYNNWLDALAAWRAVQEFTTPAAVAVKHATPCGIGAAATPAAAFRLARDADPESIFGGIVAFNRPVDGEAAGLLAEIFLEVVVAPAFTAEALQALTRRKNLRILEPVPGAPEPPGTTGAANAAAGGGRWNRAEDEDGRHWEVRGLGELWLIQRFDPPVPAGARQDWRVVTRAVPTEEQWAALDFAWRAVKACRSNAIVVAAPQPGGGWRTLGIGAGQTSRVRAVEQALALAGAGARGAVLASDGFFPFPDSVERAAAAGIAAIIQPGGSVRDGEVIAAADEAGIAMVVTGRRHFRH